jgi:hypothetical protein
MSRREWNNDMAVGDFFLKTPLFAERIRKQHQTSTQPLIRSSRTNSVLIIINSKLNSTQSVPVLIFYIHVFVIRLDIYLCLGAQ